LTGQKYVPVTMQANFMAGRYFLAHQMAEAAAFSLQPFTAMSHYR
jgi:hypothetical protein